MSEKFSNGTKNPKHTIKQNDSFLLNVLILNEEKIQILKSRKALISLLSDFFQYLLTAFQQDIEFIGGRIDQFMKSI